MYPDIDAAGCECHFRKAKFSHIQTEKIVDLFNHCSLINSYLRNISNSLSPGPRIEGLNCVHKLALSPVLYTSRVKEHVDQSEVQQDNNVRGYKWF